MRTINRHLLLTPLVLMFSLYAVAQNSTVVDVPMSFYGTRPAIEVRVNDKGPFLFLIDTGAQGQARADTSLVRQLNLPSIGQTATSDASSTNSATVNKVRVDRMSIGALQFRDVTALSRNYNTASYLPHLDGILGFDLFADYLLTLDYPNRRVLISRGELPKPDGVHVIGFEMRNGNPYVDVSVGKLKLKALLDSGNIRAIDCSASLVSRLALASYPRVIGKGSSVSGESELKEVRLLDTFSIASSVFPEPTVTFADDYEEINIGSAMLREFVVTVDQKNRRVSFVKTESR